MTSVAAAQSRQCVGHVDVDAFFAAVEQRDKPSLRGRPVVVGGTGPRGVVATASYEARAYGVHSAMPMAEARRRCPSAAVLAGRFEAYRASSAAVMSVLVRHSAQIEPVSLDEAYLLIPSHAVDGSVQQIREQIADTTGLTASVGVGWSKLVAKIASDAAKPDGVLQVLDDEQAFLDPLPIRALPGVGPQTQARLHSVGVAQVRQLRRLELAELTGLLGQAHGAVLWRLARGQDERTVQADHEAKSVSVEQTFDNDLSDPVLVQAVVGRMAGQVSARLREAGVSGRTVTVKARYPDFTTVTRSSTRPGPTDDARTIARMAELLLPELDLARGIRLLGVGCGGLTSWVQDDLFDEHSPDAAGSDDGAGTTPRPTRVHTNDDPGSLPRWRPGQDVAHTVYGRGWVWGSGSGLVTVRFETRTTPPGPVRTLQADDPLLSTADPEPLADAL